MVAPTLSTLVAILVLFGLLFALVHRVWTAIGLLVYVLGFILIMSTIKQSFLGSAMSLADVQFFLLRPIENFHLFVNYPLLGIALTAVCMGFALCVWLGLKLERPIRHMQQPRHGMWVSIAAASVSLLAGAVALLMPSAPSRTQANEADAYAAFKDMFKTPPVSGVIDRLNLFFDNRSIAASLPPPLEQNRFTTVTQTTGTGSGDALPDIFLVLEESTFDPLLIKSCRLRDCDNSMLHPPRNAQRSQQGPLLVHSTGGGTWLSEFALMSGFDWRTFGPGGAYAPVSLAPRLQNALPARLHALGYRTVAIYPTDGNFLSAKLAYRQYGFDEFYAAADLQLPNEWQDVYDRKVFDAALKQIEQINDPRPVFVFALTIRNHGPHGEGTVPLSAAFRQSEQRYGKYLADYLSRMRDSSDDFSRLAKQWLDSPRPRVVGWFGDHQPEAAWDFTQKAELLQRDRLATNINPQQLLYLTMYQLSANFGAQGHQVSRDALDLAYLGEHMLAFAGLPLDAGGTAAQEVAAACKGLMLSCADRKLVNEYLSYRIYQLAEVH